MTIRFSIKNLMTIAAVSAVVYIAYMSRQVLLVSIFGLLLAYMLNPVVTKLHRFTKFRAIAALIVMLFCGGMMVLFALWLLPSIYNDIESFTRQLPTYTAYAMTQLSELGDRLDIDLSSTTLHHQAIAAIKDSGTYILKWMGGMAGSVQYAFAVTANIILVPVISFFALADYPKIQRFMDEYIGTSHEKGVRKYISLFSNVMSSYFRGQFAVMAVLCVLYSIALSIVGLDMAILLGIVSGLLSIVPYLGFTIGIILSVVIAGIQFQDIWHPVYVIIGYTIVQMIESFIVTPKIVGDSLGMHPLAIIIVLLIGGAVFGLVGMIFALPIASAIFTLYKERYNKYKASEKNIPPHDDILGEDTLNS